MLNMRKIVAVVFAIFLLSFGGITPVHAVTTNTEASGIRQSFKADWVNQIDQELGKPQLRWTFLYDPRDPRSQILNALDQAAEAVAQQNMEKARELVNTAFMILEEGHRLGYYPQSQVDAIKDTITQHLPEPVA